MIIIICYLLVYNNIYTVNYLLTHGEKRVTRGVTKDAFLAEAVVRTVDTENDVRVEVHHL